MYPDFVHVKYPSGLPSCGPKIESVTPGIPSSSGRVQWGYRRSDPVGGVRAVFVWKVRGHGIVDPGKGSEGELYSKISLPLTSDKYS